MELRERLLQELYEQLPGLGRLSAIGLVDCILALARSFFPPKNELRPGQLRWPAVHLSDGPGKRLEDTRLLPVTLDLALAEPWSHALCVQERTRVAVALFEQARAQGALLTTADVGAILCRSVMTIRASVATHQRTTATVVPTRANAHDIGPGVTHRMLICEKLLLEGRSVEQTAAETHHSVAAVTRYLKHFRRVHFCLQSGLDLERTAYLTGLSPKLVRKCQALQAQLARRLEQDAHRLEEGTP